uniref:Uncharacterized protein n=1 Tax=Anabas testudineus TaxID=64144 RepID=A0A7N6BC61_ANATE
LLQQWRDQCSPCVDVLCNTVQLIKLHLNQSLSLICFLCHTLWVPVSLPPRSPCVHVSHLSFGCCADGSLLVNANPPSAL